MTVGVPRTLFKPACEPEDGASPEIGCVRALANIGASHERTPGLSMGGWSARACPPGTLTVST